MEFYTDLYKRAFSKVKASPEKIQEVIAMTEDKRKPRRIVRRLLIAAMISALALLAAVGANAASGGEIFTHVTAFMGSPQKMPDTQGAKCLVRMKNGLGGETEFLANRVEYIPESNTLKVWMNTPDGEEIGLSLQLDESCRQYGSYEEMLRQEGPATGSGPDGSRYEITLK